MTFELRGHSSRGVGLQDLAKKLLLAVLVGVATTIGGKGSELAWGHVKMPGVFRELTLGIWYVWLGLAAAATFYVIVTLRERAKKRRAALERWRAAAQTNIERVRVGAQTALNQMGADLKWPPETKENNRIKLEWPQE